MLKGLRTSLSPEFIARFWAKVNRSQTKDDCWLWMAGTARGYGQLALPRDGGKFKVIYAHRLAWLLTNGDTDGLQVLHRCDTPRCCNPDHLFLGTQQDNLSDARQKGRLVDGRGARRLSNEEYIAILTAPRERGSGQRLAAQFGVHEMTISRIRNGHFVHGPSLPGELITKRQPVEPQADGRHPDQFTQVFEPVPSVQIEIRGEVR